MHDSLDALVQWVEIWRVSMNPGQFACSHDARILRNGWYLGSNSIILSLSEII